MIFNLTMERRIFKKYEYYSFSPDLTIEPQSSCHQQFYFRRYFRRIHPQPINLSIYLCHCYRTRDEKASDILQRNNSLIIRQVQVLGSAYRRQLLRNGITLDHTNSRQVNWILLLPYHLRVVKEKVTGGVPVEEVSVCNIIYRTFFER